MPSARAVALMAPPDLTGYLSRNGVTIVRDLIDDPALFVRGGGDEIERFARRLQSDFTGDAIGLGVLGNPLSDFPGLPPLLRLLESRGIATEIVPGVPRATLSASITMPLVPLPPQSAHHSWDDLVEIMARLRMGCPWDREQTHRTLVPYLIEETYEVVEAIEGEQLDALCEELGDLLLQIVFHAQLATEVGKFSIADVVDALSNKMVRRHPHVFGDAVIEDVDAQWRNWEKLKALEKTGRERKSRLDGIPQAPWRAAARPADAGEGGARRLRLAERHREFWKSSPRSCASSPKRGANRRTIPTCAKSSATSSSPS